MKNTTSEQEIRFLIIVPASTGPAAGGLALTCTLHILDNTHKRKAGNPMIIGLPALRLILFLLMMLRSDAINSNDWCSSKRSCVVSSYLQTYCR